MKKYAPYGKVSNMDAKQIGWSRHYQRAIRRYIAQGSPASLRPASMLGRQAMALKLETLDLALIHKWAISALAFPSGSSRGPMAARRMDKKRANNFFAETIVPVEKSHHAARMADARVRQLTRKLHRRTAESTTSTREWKRGIFRRKEAEAALKASGKLRSDLLQESRSIQNHLRQRVGEILTVAEGERQKASRHLHDEIAQMLVATNLRLLTLKSSTKANTKIIEKDIAESQRLVQQSAHAIQRLALRPGPRHEA